MKKNREIIRIDETLCDGCGACIPSCAEGALRIVDGKARLVGEVYCDGLGACLAECPRGALSIEVREAEGFDEAAVERLLHAERRQEQPAALERPCGCPSMQAFDFGAKSPTAPGPGASALRNWPVKLRLVPPQAPFLKDADLLVAADCAPVAASGLHERFLPGRVVLLACPKFEDPEETCAKLSDILRSSAIRSVLVLELEVPCCGALGRLVARAARIAGADIDIQAAVVGRDGNILRQGPLAGISAVQQASTP